MQFTKLQKAQLKALASSLNIDPVFERDEYCQIFHLTLDAPQSENNDSHGWVVGIETIIPGIRYRRDGSGEPDSADWDEVKSWPNFNDAIHHMGELIGRYLADVAIENGQYDLMCPECDGSGMIDYESSDCLVCEGTGQKKEA